jgi:hypothetical protein
MMGSLKIVSKRVVDRQFGETIGVRVALFCRRPPYVRFLGNCISTIFTSLQGCCD